MSEIGDTPRQVAEQHDAFARPRIEQSSMPAYILTRASMFEGLLSRYDRRINWTSDQLYKDSGEHGAGLVHESQRPDGLTTRHKVYQQHATGGILTFTKEVELIPEIDDLTRERVVFAQLNPLSGEVETGYLREIPWPSADQVREQPLTEDEIRKVTDHVLADFGAAIDLRDQILTVRNEPSSSVAARFAQVLAYGHLKDPR